MTVNDDWVAAAFSDNDLVAEVLVTLRASTPQPPPPPPPPSKRRTPAWTIHQRRSRTQPLLPASNKSEPPRTSPSTPLSWSGGGATSVSGGVTIVDGVDSTEPNRNLSNISRSKVMPHGETTPTKRPRKKKTLAALKEEEEFLIEEQIHLKRKLIALQSNCEKQRKQNETLKKMKLDIQQPNNQFEEINERKDKVFLPDLNDPVGEDVIVSN